MRCFTIESDQVVSDQFDEEMFLVNFKNGRYYAMRGTAVAIWKLLHKPQTAETIAENLKRPPRDRSLDIVPEISSFLERLEQEGLVTPSQSAPEVDVGDPEAAAGEDYTSPALEVFDDLSELIVIDPVHEVDNKRGWPIQQER